MGIIYPPLNTLCLLVRTDPLDLHAPPNRKLFHY